MERVVQMHVIPDILPSIEPVADVRVKAGKDVLPGVFLDAAEVGKDNKTDVHKY
jgi:hypothetical protein